MITRIALAILISLLNFLLNAQETNTELETSKKGITINIIIPKTATNKGKVYFALFNSEEQFTQGVAYKTQASEIVDLKTKVQFTNIPVGEYAITCFHDVNDNKQLDFEGFIPTEDFGTSNNPQLFGPPQFNTTKFKVIDKDLNLIIKF
jgi:uncharacterized protein (DUF2141 family)